MISVIVTSKGEIEIIDKCIKAIIKQLDISDELIIVSPDIQMFELVKKYKKTFKNILCLSDKREGKPLALMLGINNAKGDYLVMTDGDTEISNNSIKYLKEHFNNLNVGAVTGQPISINSKNNIFGLWSHSLTNTAHEIRLMRNKKNDFIECSGYLYMIRKGLVTSINKNALADDSAISQQIASKGYLIKYEPKAKVLVKYPDNFKDWINQKVRSTGGYVQDYASKSKFKMRNFWIELFGFWKVLKYAKSIKELCWLCLLLVVRLYVWILILLKIKIQKQSLQKLWNPIKSTK